MIDQNLSRQLRSIHTPERRQAVVSLARAGDPAAIETLKQIEQTDADPTIRDLATKAIRHLEKQRWQQMAGIPPELPPDFHTLAQEKPPKEVGEGKKKLGKRYLSRALKLHFEGETTLSLKELKHAVKTDPALVNDPAAQGLASDLMGTSREIAMAQLTELKGAAKEDTGDEAPAIDSILMTVMTFILEALVLILVFDAAMALYFHSTVTLYSNTRTIPPEFVAFLSEKPIDLLRASLPGAFLGGGIVFLLGVVVYILGVILGGSGLIGHMVRAILRVFTIVGVVFIVGSSIILLGEGTNLAIALTRTVPMLNMLIMIGAIVGQSYLVIRLHKFSTARAFVTVFISNVIAMVVSMLLLFFLVYSLLNKA
jgi:hypothetical protein